MSEQAARRTPLYDIHLAAGARMVPFAGWEMPIQYAGVVEEHRAVRARAGLFDVSHMGEIRIEGPAALGALQGLLTSDLSRLAVGQGLYSPMCNPVGGIVDDLIAFRVAESIYMLVVNSSRADADLSWIREKAGDAIVRDVSDETALLALQGPRAEAILSEASGADLSRMEAFQIAGGFRVAGVSVTVARTGYTGEDGFEISAPWNEAPAVWEGLFMVGRARDLVPVGLGARDTLRLESGMMLYGQDIDETTSPLEAPLSWTVSFDKDGFVGKEALAEQRRSGVTRRLVGIETTERAIPRHGASIFGEGGQIGSVTSGTFSPTLQRPIGMGYVQKDWAVPGREIEAEARGRRIPARVVRLPFYRREGR